MSCLRPIQIRDNNGNLQTVVCGKCPSCFYTKTAGWTFRLLQEEKNSLSACFITLTYDTDHLVTTPFGRRSLCKYDLQNFFKRLRGYHRNERYYIQPIKYYAVGEYGTQTKRPHYHALLFNANEECIQRAWTLESKLIGDIYYGDVCGASVGYTLKYLCKPRHAGKFGDDDRHPEFSLNSNGLGLSYLTDNMISWHKADFYNRRFLTLPGGVKTAMPRYYYQRIYDGYERDLLKMSGSLIAQDKFYSDFYSKTPEQFHADILLYENRVNAAFARQDYLNSKILVL